MSLTPFAPFWPDVIEEECSDEEAKKDSNGTIAKREMKSARYLYVVYPGFLYSFSDG